MAFYLYIYIFNVSGFKDRSAFGVGHSNMFLTRERGLHQVIKGTLLSSLVKLVLSM